MRCTINCYGEAYGESKSGGEGETWDLCFQYIKCETEPATRRYQVSSWIFKPGAWEGGLTDLEIRF